MPVALTRDFVKMTIPGDMSYLPVCQSCVRAFAKKIGFADKELSDIELSVEEAVSNVIRHAGAGKVEVAVGVGPGEVALVVTDDGCGFDPAADHAGNGLANIRARLQRFGGTLEWQNTKPGMRLALRLPARDSIGQP